MANSLLNNLIGYWGLDEAAGANNALDKHSGARTLTQYNSPGATTGKIYTNARTFNGSAGSTQHFRRDSETALQIGDNDATFAAWVYLSVTNAMQVIAGKVGNDSDYLFYYDNTVSRFKFGVSPDGVAVVEATANNFGAPSTGTWYLLIGWHDAANNQVGISVNNGTANTVAHSTGVYSSTSPFAIGSGWDGSNTFWQLNGRLQSVCMWKSAAGGGGVLTSTQRTDLYNSGSGLAYASFDSGGISGTLSATLGAATVSAAGIVAVAGALSGTLGALTVSSAGTVAVAGVVDSTLGTLTLSATGNVGSTPITGTLDTTLGALTSSSAGAVAVAGTLAKTLGAATLSSAGTVAIAGTTAATLGALTVAANGYILTNATVGGVLRQNSTNGRYLENDSGPLIVAGFHTWADVQDTGGSYPPTAFDWDEYLDALVAKGANYTKLWSAETGRGYPSNIDLWFYPPRYVRTGPGNDNDGKLKFDLSQINPDYLTRLRTRAIEAGNAGIYVCVQFFNAFHVSDKGDTYNPWTYHPYNIDNNINSVDGDQDNDGQGYDVNAVSGNVALPYQKALIEAMIDATADLDNVIYEICNESTGGARAAAAQAWQEELLDHAQTYLAGIGRANPVGLTVMYPDGSNSWLDGTAAAWVSYNADKADLVHAATDPPSMYDTDHTTGGDNTRTWIITAFCEGHGGLWLMDLWDSGAGGAGDMRADANYEQARRTLGWVLDYAARIDLANATPNATISSTGYALVKTSTRAQVLAYQSGSGAFTVDLSTLGGTFAVEWQRVANSAGTIQADSDVSGGAVRTLTPPWAGEDVIAFLEQTGASGALSVTLGALTASAAGTVAVAGASSITLGTLAVSSTGTVAIAGTASVTLSALTSSASGTVTVTGAAAVTLETLTLAATGVVGSTPITGALDATLGVLTATAAGVVAVTGTLDATLGALTVSAAGTVPALGALAATLDALTLSALGFVGEVPIQGTLAATLGELTSMAAGVVPVTGGVDATPGALTCVGTGVTPVTGATVATLGAVTVAAAGAVVVVGGASVALGDLTLSAAAYVGDAPAVAGTLDVTLGGLTVAGAGVVAFMTTFGRVVGPGGTGTARGPKTTSTIGV